MKTYYTYMWLNLVNDKTYIGYSGNIKARYTFEKWELEKGIEFNHCKTHPLVRSYNHHGSNNFKFLVLHEFKEKQEAIDEEINLISLYKKLYLSYNITDGGEVGSGPVSEKTREKRRQIRLGTHHSEETKQKMSQASKGRPKSDSHRKKISESKINALSPMHGKKHTEESKQKNSLVQKERFENSTHPWCGRKHTEETKQKIREKRALQVMQPKSPESIEKTRQAHLGSKRSDETRKKISEAAKRRSSKS